MSDAAPLRLFHHRPFLFHCLSRVFSTAGSQMQAVAVAWQVYELTHSAFALGMVGLAQFLPRLLLITVVGNVADRFDRKKVAFLGQAVQALTLATLAVASFHGQVSQELIYCLVIVGGAARSFETPAIQAILPTLVGNEALPRAVALGASAMEAATIISPALGGVLYVFGASTVYAITAASFTIAAILCSAIVPLETWRRVSSGSGFAHFLEGIRFIRSRRAVLGAISLDLFAVLLGGATALLPIVAHQQLHTGSWGLGLLRSAPAVGALLCSLWLAHHPLRRQVGRKMFAAVALFGLTTIAFGLSHSIALSLAALILLGAADMVSVVIRAAFVQLQTPDAMRGRVGAVNSVFIGASNQLGEFESGLSAAAFGTVPAILIGGLGTLAVAYLWMLAFPELRDADTLDG
ncbi:MFS transporter [Niveibacterium terrae]|uniref:MFS transporter n=1 Tax=Niveibacterium terrae TaxID=3373598 RepID=UPI003A95404E